MAEYSKKKPRYEIQYRINGEPQKGRGARNLDEAREIGYAWVEMNHRKDAEVRIYRLRDTPPYWTHVGTVSYWDGKISYFSETDHSIRPVLPSGRLSYRD